jgi:hypothetical protein
LKFLQLTLSGGFDFLVAPLTHPRYRRRPTEALPLGQIRPPFARADVLLTTGQWSSQASTLRLRLYQHFEELPPCPSARCLSVRVLAKGMQVGCCAANKNLAIYETAPCMADA